MCEFPSTADSPHDCLDPLLYALFHIPTSITSLFENHVLLASGANIFNIHWSIKETSGHQTFTLSQVSVEEYSLLTDGWNHGSLVSRNWHVGLSHHLCKCWFQYVVLKFSLSTDAYMQKHLLSIHSGLHQKGVLPPFVKHISVNYRKKSGVHF